MMAMIADLTISAWNMRTLASAGPYLHELITEHETDILCLSEHRLYESELHRLQNIGAGFEMHAKASSDLNDHYQSRKPGHCGVAILWSPKIANRVRVIDCDSDRICIIEIIGAYQGKSLFVFSVLYVP